MFRCNAFDQSSLALCLASPSRLTSLSLSDLPEGKVK